MQKLLTLKQAAEALNCSVATINRMTQRGELTRVKFSSSVRVYQSEIERISTPKKTSYSAGDVRSAVG